MYIYHIHDTLCIYIETPIYKLYMKHIHMLCMHMLVCYIYTHIIYKPEYLCVNKTKHEHVCKNNICIYFPNRRYF